MKHRNNILASILRKHENNSYVATHVILNEAAILGNLNNTAVALAACLCSYSSEIGFREPMSNSF